jgi:hypothetical protein
LGTAAVLVAMVIALLTLAAANKTIPTAGPLAISLASLAISLISAFRAEIFPFQLKVLPGGLCTARHSDVSAEETDELDLILPIAFLNTGFGEGVIEGVTVKMLAGDGTTMLYRPNLEVDLKSFMQGLSVPSKANIIGMFTPFPLHAKQSVQKIWLFTQDTRENPYPRSTWRAGTYRFDYFVKESQWAKPKKLATMEQVIDEPQLTAAHNGVAVLLAIKGIAP